MLVSDETFSQAMEYLSKADSLAWDLETSGLQPYRGDRLIGVALEAGGRAFYFPHRHRAGRNLEDRKLPMVLDLLTSGVPLVGFNSCRFDAAMVAVEGPRYYDSMLHDDRINHQDVIIMALLSNVNEPSFSLAALGEKYLGSDAAKGARQASLLEALHQLHPKLRAKRQLMGHIADLPPKTVASYACADVLDTRALAAKYLPSLEEWGLTALLGEYCRYARLLAKMEARGLLVDRRECLARAVRCSEEQERVLAAIRREAGAGFNPNSPQQVARLTGLPDAEATTLERSGHPLAAMIVDYKKLAKLRGTFYEGIAEALDEHDVIRPQQNLTRDQSGFGGTRTGRLSCSKPNLQTLPTRSPGDLAKVRRIIVARPGYRLLKADLERAEMYVAGSYTGDTAIHDAYHDDRDLYTELATAVGITRAQAKTLFLAVQYGAGPWKIADYFGWAFRSVPDMELDFCMPASEWGNLQWETYKSQKPVRARAGVFAIIPGVQALMKTLEERAAAWRHIRLFTGRVLQFDGVKSKPWSAFNSLIQGSVAEAMRLGMQRAEAPLEAIGAYQLLAIHDEQLIEVPEGRLVAAIGAVRQAMCDDFPFALKPRVSIAVGYNYEQMETMNETT